MTLLHLHKSFDLTRKLYMAGPETPAETAKASNEALDPAEIKEVAEHNLNMAENFLKEIESGNLLSEYNFKIDREKPRRDYPVSPEMNRQIEKVVLAMGRLKEAMKSGILSEHDINATASEFREAGTKATKTIESSDPLWEDDPRMLGVKDSSDIPRKQEEGSESVEVKPSTPAQRLADAAKALHGLQPAMPEGDPESAEYQAQKRANERAYDREFSQLENTIVSLAEELGATVDGVLQETSAGNVLIVKDGPTYLVITSNKDQLKDTSAAGGWEAVAVGGSDEERLTLQREAGTYVDRFRDQLMA